MRSSLQFVRPHASNKLMRGFPRQFSSQRRNDRDYAGAKTRPSLSMMRCERLSRSVALYRRTRQGVMTGGEEIMAGPMRRDVLCSEAPAKVVASTQVGVGRCLLHSLD